MNNETVTMAIDVADRAARELVRAYLRPVRAQAGWYQTRLPPGMPADQAAAVRTALRYLHRRGLIWDHPHKGWIKLSPPPALHGGRRRAGVVQ